MTNTSDSWPECRRSVVLGLALLLSLGTLGAMTATAEGVTDDPAYTHPERVIDVGGGRKMNLYCLGKGSPTVVFEAGLSSWNMVWVDVQPVIARYTRACSYDRAGLGFSDPGPRPATAANIVSDLHALLKAGGIRPPYVLVGHSAGGLYVRLYADEYRSEVVGMVLVDPVVEGEMLWDAAAEGRVDPRNASRLERFRECDAAINRLPHGYIPGSVLYKTCIDSPDPRFGPRLNATIVKVESTVPFQNAQLSEFSAGYSGVSFDQVIAAQRFYGVMPLIVLSKTPDPATLPVAQRNVELQVLWELHEQLSALSVNGQHRGIANTGHDIQIDQPGAVIGAIRDVMAAIHQKKGRSPEAKYY